MEKCSRRLFAPNSLVCTAAAFKVFLQIFLIKKVLNWQTQIFIIKKFGKLVRMPWKCHLWIFRKRLLDFKLHAQNVSKKPLLGMGLVVLAWKNILTDNLECAPAEHKNGMCTHLTSEIILVFYSCWFIF